MRALTASGVDVISFGAGEPDFNTPTEVCDAAIQAIEKGDTRYTASSGTPQLKEAIVQKMQREIGVRVEPAQIVASCGAKHSVYNALMTLVEPGDEVILIAPFWMTYRDQIELAGGVPVMVHTTVEQEFIPEIEAIKAAITSKTKAIILNSPSNPTGAVLSRQTLKEIAALCLRQDIWIIADEIYERLVYGIEHASIYALGEEVRARTIYISGCSKTYAMTGWRLGYAVAPIEVATAMSNLQDQVTSNPTSFVQVGAIAALNLPDQAVEAMRAEFEARRNLVVRELRAIPDVVCPMPEGAFYAFPDISAYLGAKIATDVELANYLLDTAHVAVVPGSVFEGAGHIRLSYATSRENIVNGVARIREALLNLR